MGSPVIAVCMNPACRTAFFTTSIYELADGVSAYLEKCTMAPCPACRGIGEIPSGLYQCVGAETIFVPRSDADRNLLERALGLVKEAVNADMPIDAFREVASQRVPELSALWKLMPTNRTEAYQFWLVILGLLAVLVATYAATKASPPQQLLVPPEILRAIESCRPNNPGDIHTGQPEELRRKSPPPATRNSPSDPPIEI